MSSFLASDGRFFLEEDDCKHHEHETRRIIDIQCRRRSLIEALRTGVFEDLPEGIRAYVSVDVDWFIETWNEVILPIIYTDDILTIDPAAIPADFYLIERKLTLAECVITHLLHGSNPQPFQGPT